MNLVCPYCGKPVAEEFNVCCGEAGHAIPEAEYAAAFGEGDDEGIEDVKAAYVSLFRSYGKLQRELDVLAAALREISDDYRFTHESDQPHPFWGDRAKAYAETARAALAKLDGKS